MEPSKADEKIIETAKKRFEVASEAVRTIRMEAVDDLNFLAGEQWDYRIKQMRQAENGICLTINRLPAILNQVTNAQRQNRVYGKVSPVDDKGDIDTAEVIQGHIRHIEYASTAQVVYGTAAFGAASQGEGYWEVVPEYCDPQSFDQEIKLKMVENPFTILGDPNGSMPDGSDWEWYFKLTYLSKDEYEEAFPDVEISDGDWTSEGASAPEWMKNGERCIAEYTYKEKKKDELCELADGSTKLKSELPEGTKVLKSREVEIPTIKWCKLDGKRILESTTKPGQYLGIVKVTGINFNIDGERVQHGIIRHAKEPQRQYNYHKSAQTQSIALMPKAKWLAAEGQISPPNRKVWESANLKNNVVLEYRQKDADGIQATAPIPIVAEPNVQAINQALAEAHADLQFTTGVHDAQLGAKSNEDSGKAIAERKVQGETGNYHYVDNLTISIAFSSRQIIDMLPTIYDTKRSIRIIGEDDAHKVVKLYEEMQGKDGQPKTYRFDVGKYDVVTSAGPSFQTRRQEAADSLLQLAKVAPIVMEKAPHLVVKSLDIPYAQEIAELITPPEAKAAENGEQPFPPAAQAQIQQATMAAQMLQEHNKQLDAELQDYKAGFQVKQMETESKERIEMMKIEKDITLAEINTKAQSLEERVAFVEDMMKQLEIHRHEAEMTDANQQHEAGMAASSQDHESQLAADAQQSQAIQAEADRSAQQPA